MSQAKSSSYSDAGVSIERGNRLVELIKNSVNETRRPGVMGDLGGFGAMFDMSALNYRNPVLVSGTDGVGTKIKLAIESGNFGGIGADLVAMCVNDLLVQGAEPLFFLDYLATSRLDIGIASSIVESIAEGCKLAGCSLVGGETAEMPGMYQDGDLDLAGFCVGVVERDNIIDGSSVSPGDIMIALASSGPHSNGYSLIRKLLTESGTELTDRFSDKTFSDVLLMPTRIYVKPVLQLIKQFEIKAIAHITGGGLLENVPRVLPESVKAEIRCNSWQWPAIFEWIQKTGSVEISEMYRTFNCGAGMVVIVGPENAGKSVEFLRKQGEDAWIAGEITGRSDSEDRIVLEV